MPRYLLQCECGQTVPVDMGQAGGQIVCKCGKSLSVPALRRLRELPQETAVTAVKTRRGWQPRHGLVAAFLILAAVPGIASLWLHLSEPKPPKFDPVGSQRHLEEQLSDLTPSMAWQWWMSNHERYEQGFQPVTFYLSPADQTKLDDGRFIKYVLLVAAAVGVVAAATAALWPSSRPAPPRAR